MADYQKYIYALRKCANEHEFDWTPTGHIIVSDLCNDTANLLEELEQEPTTKNDLVTLTFSKGTLKYSCKDYVVYKKDWLRSHYGAEIDIMFGDSQYKEPATKNDLPHCQHTDSEIAKSFIEDVEAVKDQLPTTKNDLGVDCISRADALDCVNWGYNLSDVYKKINVLPSVTPQEPFINKPCVSEKVCEHDKQMALDKIRAEIKALSPEPTAYDVVDGNPIKDAIWETLIEVDKIIDKYKAEGENP